MTAALLALAVAATRRSISELAIAAVVGSAAYNATVSSAQPRSRIP